MESSLVNMDPSALTLALIAGAFTLLGAVVGAGATIFAARKTAQHQQEFVESSIFRAAFVDALIALRRMDTDVFAVLADSVLSEHERAKVRIEPWVSRDKLPDFANAWALHAQSLMTRAPGSLRNREEECRAAVGRIEVLLSFAARGA
jgi:hypothetical protein